MLHRTNSQSHRSEQEGCDYEVRILGRARCPYTETGEVSYERALELVMSSQPYRKTETVVMLEREFARHGLTAFVYTAVESWLDFKRSTDAFVVFRFRRLNRVIQVIVTLDLTLNPIKEVSGADLVFGPEAIADIGALAASIGRVCVSKMQRM